MQQDLPAGYRYRYLLKRPNLLPLLAKSREAEHNFSNSLTDQLAGQGEVRTFFSTVKRKNSFRLDPLPGPVYKITCSDKGEPHEESLVSASFLSYHFLHPPIFLLQPAPVVNVNIGRSPCLFFLLLV